MLIREGEELRAPRHASATATRDGNIPYIVTACLYSRQLLNLKTYNNRTETLLASFRNF